MSDFLESPELFNNHDMAFMAHIMMRFAASENATLEDIAKIHDLCQKIEGLLSWGDNEISSRERLIKEVEGMWDDSEDSSQQEG